MTEKTRQVFSDSISRCYRNPRFLDLFYEKLRDASPRLVTLFVLSDLPDEKLPAKASIHMCLQAVFDGAQGGASVEHLGQRHRHDHETPPELYDQWLECLIVAASASDPYFDAFTEQAWRAMLRPVIEIMQRGSLQEGPPLDTERDPELARLKRENARLLEENEMLKERFFKAGPWRTKLS